MTGTFISAAITLDEHGSWWVTATFSGDAHTDYSPNSGAMLVTQHHTTKKLLIRSCVRETVRYPTKECKNLYEALMAVMGG